MVYWTGPTDSFLHNFVLWHSDVANSPPSTVALYLAVGGHKISDFHIWGEALTTGLHVPATSNNNQISNFTIESSKAGGTLLLCEGASNYFRGHLYDNTTDHANKTGLKFGGTVEFNHADLIISNVGVPANFNATGVGNRVKAFMWMGSILTNPPYVGTPGAGFACELFFVNDSTNGGLFAPGLGNMVNIPNSDYFWFDGADGPVVRAPNGNFFRLAVSNTGALSGEAI
jgi:hypothetical protein